LLRLADSVNSGILSGIALAVVHCSVWGQVALKRRCISCRCYVVSHRANGKTTRNWKWQMARLRFELGTFRIQVGRVTAELVSPKRRWRCPKREGDKRESNSNDAFHFKSK